MFDNFTGAIVTILGFILGSAVGVGLLLLIKRVLL